MGEWVGLGPSAASQQALMRGSNIADLPRWAVLVGQGDRVTEDRTALTPTLLAEDALVFGLRMNRGVDLGLLRARSPEAPWERVEALIGRLSEEGLASCDGTRLRLEPKGRLLADSIGSEIMVAFGRPAEMAASP
jgi:oxygen-independent coproporphyrinogen-3 oxidase